MVEFNLWFESFVFCAIYSFIIITSCIFAGILGCKMFDRLGQYPTKTPIIQMELFLPFIILEILTFGALLGFYNAFSS